VLGFGWYEKHEFGFIFMIVLLRKNECGSEFRVFPLKTSPKGSGKKIHVRRKGAYLGGVCKLQTEDVLSTGKPQPKRNQGKQTSAGKTTTKNKD